MNPHDKCCHDIEEEVRDGNGKTVAHRCTTCLRIVPWGPCPGVCMRIFTMLPVRATGGTPCCSDACAAAVNRRRTKQLAAARKKARAEGRGEQRAFGFLVEGDALTKARR